MNAPPEPQPAPAAPRRRALAILLGAAVPLLALEIGLRIRQAVVGTYTLAPEIVAKAATSPWTISDDPELLYVHRTDAPTRALLRIDPNGILRPRDVTPAKPPGTLRVALLGDSVGAAMYLIHTERMGTLLELRLAAELGRNVEVLNFCVNGYDTAQEARLLETQAARFDPDAIVVVYCLNDAGVSETPRAWFRPPERPLLETAAFVRDVVARARGRSPGRAVAPELGPGDAAAAPRWEQMYERDGEGFRTVENGLDRIAAWAKARDVPVLVAIAPLVLMDDPVGRTTLRYRSQVAEAVRARGLGVIDLQEPLARLTLGQMRFSDGDIYHLGAAAQPEAARALARLVAPMLAARSGATPPPK